MSVRSIAAFREEQKAVRVVEVCRVLAENTPDVKCCGYGRYNLLYRCTELAEFIVSTVGSKRGWFVCGECVEPMLREQLIAPPEEYPERERRRLEEQMRDQAYRDREARRAAHTGCAGDSEKDPDGLCRRPPIALARFDYCYIALEGGGTKLAPPKPYCARHLVAFRRSRNATIEPIAAEASPMEAGASG